MTTSGRFQPGQSGNRNGRPKGSSNKALTNRQLAEMLAKSDKAALDVVRELMVTSDNPNLQLRAALAWLGASKDMRNFLHKVAQDAKENAGTNEQPEEVEEDSVPIVSLKSIK